MKKSVYGVFYLERKYYTTINADLESKGYNCRAIIPEIEIVRKTLKGKPQTEKVPLLFNYGFMRMTTKQAYSRPFLNKLKRTIAGIRTWVKDPDPLFIKKIKRRIDNAEDFDDFSKVALITKEEVRRFQRLAKRNNIYSDDDYEKLKPGTELILRLYPYDGLRATILEVHRKKHEVTLEMYPMMGVMKATLPIDHVLPSVYDEADPDKVGLKAKETPTNLEDNSYDGSTTKSLGYPNED